MGDEAVKAYPFAESLLLSPGEWQIFYMVSKRGPLTIRQLVTEITSDRKEADRRYTTMLTLAQRLVKKGYLSLTPPRGATRGRTSAATYTATVAYEEALQRHAERFLSQYALGTPDDLQRIRNLLDQHLERS
jgi:predicted transcriptional regulator